MGGARTALYNWIYARQHGGTFILRIDDTDHERNRPEWTQGIQDALRWLEISFDEGPYFQSQRTERYAEVAEDLFRQGKAYYCDCPREEIDRRAKERGGPPGYDGFCRDRGLAPGEGRALRFRVPSGQAVVHDLVRGDVVFENETIEDFILVKGNGAALYVLANFVDDIDYRITHVMRAEEHLPTTPKAVLLYQALSIEPPVFAHLPVLVNERRVKLSKRRDRVAVEDFAAEGFLPEAMCNYLALLGWSPGTNEEFFDREELVRRFDLTRVSHSPAFFDVTKMTHFNKHYLSELDDARFIELAMPYLETLPGFIGDDAQRGIIEVMAPLVRARIALLSEVKSMYGFFFQAPSDDSFSLDGPGREILVALRHRLFALVEWTADAIDTSMRAYAEEAGVAVRKVQAPLRLAVTGAKIGPPLFESLALLGREEVIRRVDAALSTDE